MLSWWEQFAAVPEEDGVRTVSVVLVPVAGLSVI